MIIIKKVDQELHIINEDNNAGEDLVIIDLGDVVPTIKSIMLLLEIEKLTI